MTKKLNLLPAALAFVLSISTLPAYASDSDPTIESIADQLYWSVMELSPVNLHFYQSNVDNIPIDLTHPLGSFSEEQTEMSILIEELSSKLKQIPFLSLDSHDRQVYLAIQDFVTANKELLSLPDYASTLGPMSGLLSTMDTLMTEYYLLSETDILNYMDLLNDIPRFLDDLLSEINYQERLGYAPSAYAYDSALERKSDLTDGNDHPYLNAFISHSAECSLSEEEIQTYTKQISSILTDNVIPAYEAFFDVLEEKRESSDPSQGLIEFDQGKEYYAALVKSNTGTKMTPDELMSYLEQKVAADMGNMSRIYFLDPSAFDEVENITLSWETADEMLSVLTEKTLETFPAIKNTEYTLSYLPEALEVENNLAYYLSPPFDLLSRNIIRVNKSEVGDDPFVLWTTLSHEGFPGHLYQTQYFMQNICRYPVENLLGSLGTSEGWAFYVERLALDWAGIDSNTADIYWYNNTIGMGLTAIVDIGVNYKGWNADDIQAYLLDYLGEIDDEAAQDMFDTAANDPAVYLPYAVGYYKLTDLFNSIEQHYDSDKEMYTAFLNHSNLPFTLLETYLGSDGSV